MAIFPQELKYFFVSVQMVVVRLLTLSPFYGIVEI